VSIAKAENPSAPRLSNWGWVLLPIGVGAGITTGLIEGAGLMLFQRLNWASWGRMIHVSWEILWISPLVDAIFFFLLALLGALAARLFPHLPAFRVFLFLLTFLSVYDWLTLTGRLYHRACLLLALGVAAAFTRWSGKRETSVLEFCRKATPWMVAAWVLVFAGIQGVPWMREQVAVSRLPRATPGTPNVLVIVVDTLRADHLSSYGYARPTSPNFDRIAQQGVLFENAISTTSWSLPAHVSLLTGRYQFEHGVGNVQPEPWSGWGSQGLGGFPSLGEALQRKGYRTGAFSANRTYFTGSLGFGRGFQHFEDYFHSPADMFVRTLFGRECARIYLNRSDKSKITRALRFLHAYSLLEKDSEGAGAYGGPQAVRKPAQIVNQETLQWIDRDRRRPFFAFLNYFDVHYPYGGPATYAKPSWDLGGNIEEYDASVKYVDDMLEDLSQALEQRGLAKNTLLIITSDHGESLGHHGLTYHGEALYWGLVHVPLVIWYPGHIPAGLRQATPVTIAAIPATIMDLAAGSGQEMFAGRSLSALLSPSALHDWPDPLSELAQSDFLDKNDIAAAKLIPTATTGSMRSLVTREWQLITHETRGDQLYDWKGDPEESSNLVNTPEGRTTALELKSRMADAMQPKKGLIVKSGETTRSSKFPAPDWRPAP
jgi:arylsulfatase A-like enzyme